MAEETNTGEKVQIKIPAEVAKIMKQWGGHSVKLAAARGALPMSGPNLVTVLFLFYHGDEAELKTEALKTLREISSKILSGVVSQRSLHPEILDLVARIRYRDIEVMEPLLMNPMIGIKTLMFIAEKSSGQVLEMVANNDQAMIKIPALRTMIINNPAAELSLKVRLGWREEPEPEPEPEDEVAESGPEQAEAEEGADEDEAEDFDADDLSKYQKLLEMPVAEKIKMALTGDKEWRNLLIREANKLVSTAVLKNPRISEGEVLAVAKNRSASDELIRIILLNREWVKNYEMKKALVVHPRTPLQKSMRFMTFLTEKDIKDLAKSRNVSQAIVNNARRMLMAKNKRK